jgi:hypothetical protein
MTSTYKTTAVYGIVLALSLGTAWHRWTAEPDAISGDDILVSQGDADKIELMQWTSEEQEVLVEARSDSEGAYLWVRYTDKKKEEEETKEFKAGEAGDKLLASFSPLAAIRSFEGLDEKKIEDIGLKEPSASFVLKRKGRERIFEIGNEAYGTRDLYVRDKASGEVFLIDDEKFRTLKYARTRLPDRRLWSMESGKISGLSLQSGEQSRSFSHQNWQDAQNAKWIIEGDEEADSTQLTTWIGKALKLKGSSYSDLPDERLELRFQMTLETEAGKEETVSFFFDAQDEGWYASSPHTRGNLKLISRTLSSLSEDLPALLGE